MSENKEVIVKFRKRVNKLLYWAGGLSVIILGFMVTKVLAAAASGGVVTHASDPKVMCWGFLAAAISTGMGTLGAGIAVAYVGAAAMGAISEKPELAIRSLIFVGLAEGIAIYGLIIAIMILGKL